MVNYYKKNTMNGIIFLELFPTTLAVRKSKVDMLMPNWPWNTKKKQPWDILPFQVLKKQDGFIGDVSRISLWLVNLPPPNVPPPEIINHWFPLIRPY